MLSGRLQATNIKDKRFSFILPYLDFTSKKPGWVERLFLFFPIDLERRGKIFFYF